mmetsp:Transcript_4614/g.10846  ORF Transcript_4614/g.10846 Transcript_4614/m.10846 type:complete len:240 (-) Transcript_4614:8-727(-)
MGLYCGRSPAQHTSARTDPPHAPAPLRLHNPVPDALAPQTSDLPLDPPYGRVVPAYSDSPSPSSRQSAALVAAVNVAPQIGDHEEAPFVNTSTTPQASTTSVTRYWLLLVSVWLVLSSASNASYAAVVSFLKSVMNTRLLFMPAAVPHSVAFNSASTCVGGVDRVGLDARGMQPRRVPASSEAETTKASEAAISKSVPPAPSARETAIGGSSSAVMVSGWVLLTESWLGRRSNSGEVTV